MRERVSSGVLGCVGTHVVKADLQAERGCGEAGEQGELRQVVGKMGGCMGGGGGRQGGGRAGRQAGRRAGRQAGRPDQGSNSHMGDTHRDGGVGRVEAHDSGGDVVGRDRAVVGAHGALSAVDGKEGEARRLKEFSRGGEGVRECNAFGTRHIQPRPLIPPPEQLPQALT